MFPPRVTQFGIPAHLFLQTTTLGTTCKLGNMIGNRNHSRVFHGLQTQLGRQDAAIQCNIVSQCRFQSQGYPGACKTYEVVWWVWTTGTNPRFRAGKTNHEKRWPRDTSTWKSIPKFETFSISWTNGPTHVLKETSRQTTLARVHFTLVLANSYISPRHRPPLVQTKNKRGTIDEVPLPIHNSLKTTCVGLYIGPDSKFPHSTFFRWQHT